ncbi:MAG: hypothetical protein GY862_31025, partial [Gammaproteobacteria bacterium]|nr:hypothetical protein [Gammaproteobacteria bacterium]
MKTKAGDAQNSDESMIDWHRLFGLALTDYFTGSAYQVGMEKDLSLQQQFLDIIIIEQSSGKFPEELPDGLDNLSRHNLVTYKSLHEPLDAWAIYELFGHYVSYRKLVSPSLDKLLPAEEFQLYAISTRRPRKLRAQAAGALKKIRKGVYELQWGSCKIRVLALNRMPPTKKNAVWQLFSALPEKVRFGASNYQQRNPYMSTLIYELYEKYQTEGIVMPYTVQDFCRYFTKKHIDLLTQKERTQGLKPKELLQGLKPKERLQGLKPKERLQGLKPKERLQGLKPKERLQGLKPKERLQG